MVEGSRTDQVCLVEVRIAIERTNCGTERFLQPARLEFQRTQAKVGAGVTRIRQYGLFESLARSLVIATCSHGLAEQVPGFRKTGVRCNSFPQLSSRFGVI